jgi:hypothetical protein
MAVNGTRWSRSIGFTQSLIEDHAADDLAGHEIETLHTLLEHFYDSQCNLNAAQLADFVGCQPVARSQDLFCPLRQFQRRVSVGGSVAHLVAKDPGSLLASHPGKVHTRDGQEAVSQVPCWRQQRQDCLAVGLADDGPIGSPSTGHTTSWRKDRRDAS